MSEGKTSNECRDLIQPIRVFVALGEVGEVQARPFSPHPISVKNLKNAKTAYYLDSFEEKACVYPIRFFQSEVNPFAPGYAFHSRYAQTPNFYGIPSAIQLVGVKKTVKGVIFEPSREIFLGTTLVGVHTYLIGDVENHLRQARAVEEFSEYLLEKWKENPFHILRAVPWDLDDPRKLPGFSDSRAKAEISKFLDWLRKEDSKLWDKAVHRLGFPVPPREKSLMETFFLRSDPVDSAYAVYDSHRRRIFFTNRIIEKLSRKEYAAVAQILAHECAHMKAHEREWVMPSEIMLQLSLEKFFEKILPRRIEGTFMELFAKDLLIPLLAQSLLPIVPEEELHALSEELRYAKEKGLGEATFSLQEEAKEIQSHIFSQLEKYFPKDWFALSLQYYFLASAFQNDD